MQLEIKMSLQTLESSSNIQKTEMSDIWLRIISLLAIIELMKVLEFAKLLCGPPPPTAIRSSSTLWNTHPLYTYTSSPCTVVEHFPVSIFHIFLIFLVIPYIEFTQPTKTESSLLENSKPSNPDYYSSNCFQIDWFSTKTSALLPVILEVHFI